MNPTILRKESSFGMVFQYQTELGLMRCHLILLLLPKQSAPDASSTKKPTSEDQSLTDTSACPVLNASKVPLTDFETSQLSKVSISVQHCMG